MEKKTLYILCGGCIGFLLLVLFGLWIMTTLTPKYYTYEQAEEKIKEATNEYYHNNPAGLPVDDGKYNLSYEALVQAELIKPLSEMIKDGETCSASITIVKQGDTYSYIPILNCGEAYQTRALADKILADNQVVTEDSGLYLEDGEYYFKGKINNNFVAFGTYERKNQNVPFLWRIISIKDGEIKLRAVNNIGKKSVWDSRYNTNENKQIGYNDFDYSEIKDTLKELETTFNFKYENVNFDISKLKARNLCIGARELDEPLSKGNIECNKLSKDKYFFGTITPYEYMRASTDKDCINPTSRSCENYNYLSIMESEWTLTPTASNTYGILVYDDNQFVQYKASTSKQIYPTIILSEYVYYNGGNGTEEDPYLIR